MASIGCPLGAPPVYQYWGDIWLEGEVSQSPVYALTTLIRGVAVTGVAEHVTLELERVCELRGEMGVGGTRVQQGARHGRRVG